MRPFLIEFLKFCTIYGTNVQIEQTHRERIFVVELKLKLRLPFHYEPIV